MLQRIQIRASSWPRQCLNCVMLETGRHYPRTVGSSVVIHVHRPSGKWTSLKMRYNYRLEDVINVTLTCKVALNGHQVQLGMLYATPDHYRASTVRNRRVDVSWCVSCVPVPPDSQSAICNVQ